MHQAIPAVGVYVPVAVKICCTTLVKALVHNKIPPAPKATLDESVPDAVKVLLAVKVLPFATVTVDPVAGCVIATLLTVVAVATPNVGVTKVGEFEPTKFPLPVTPDSPLFRMLIVLIKQTP
jgi:hypothetical protein